MENDLVEAKLGLSQYDGLLRAARDAINLRQDEDDAAYRKIDYVLLKIEEVSSDSELILAVNRFFNYIPNFSGLSSALESLKTQPSPNFRECYERLRVLEDKLEEVEEISRGKKVFC